MKKDINIFFELLRVAVGSVASLSSSPSAEDWEIVFGYAKKQALVGVCFSAIEKLPKEQQPRREVLMQWWAMTQKTEERNKVLNSRSVEACRYFEKLGFKTCVMKGQGNALLYPWPLRRQSGDIDIWCVAPKVSSELNANLVKVNLDKSRREVLKWVRKRYPKEEFDMKHIHFPIIQNVPMEVHFVPSLLRSPFANHRLMEYYEREALEQIAHCVKMEGVEDKLGKLNCPTVEFNLIFQLTHIFNHFLSEGVGLRQVMDYFFLLRAAREEWKASPSTPLSDTAGGSLRQDNKRSVIYTIQQIGLYGFLEAMMWVMHEVLGLKEEEMIAPMDEKRGQVLLDEILAGGNFGHYESRYWYQGMSRWKFYLARMRRMAHFLHYYPTEVLWDMPFRMKQRVWMAWNKN